MTTRDLEAALSALEQSQAALAEAEKERELWKRSSCALEAIVRENDDKMRSLRARLEAAARVLRGAWVIEDGRVGVCVVATDDEGVPFRFGVNQVVAPYWKRWEAERRAAIAEMEGK